MIDTNYKVEALEYLLDKKCLMERYYPLIQFKEELINKSKKLGCKTKNDIAKLSDHEFKELGLNDEKMLLLFRRFLKLYDPNHQKFKEIDKLNIDEQERLAFEELYYLPGVKYTRASLYYCAGYKTLKDLANADEKEILEKTALVISKYNLSCVVPLLKEVRTHIAVAKAFTSN